MELDMYRDALIDVHYAGAMHQDCRSCHALMFAGEAVCVTNQSKGHYKLCCHNGKMAEVPRIPAPSGALLTLLTDRSKRSQEFRQHIRQYSAALSFVSFGAYVSVPPGNGPPVFRIHGAVYHMSGLSQR